MTKVEKGPEGSEKQKIENLYQFLDFLEKEFGENVTEKFFKLMLEQRAGGAHRIISDNAEAKTEWIRRLKDTEVSPVTVAKLNQIIDIRLKKLEITLRNHERFGKNMSKEEKEMLNAMKGKEVVIDEEGIIVKKSEK